MQGLAAKFGIRWLASTLGLLAAAGAFPNHIQLITNNQPWAAALVAGFLLALVNMLLKPILIFLSIPALILTLGFFMLVVNGFTVWLVASLYSSLLIDSFGWAVVAGIIIGFVNFVISRVLKELE